MKRWRIYFIRSTAFPEGRWHIDENGETLTLAFPDTAAACDALRLATGMLALVDPPRPRLKLVSAN